MKTVKRGFVLGGALVGVVSLLVCASPASGQWPPPPRPNPPSAPHVGAEGEGCIAPSGSCNGGLLCTPTSAGLRCMKPQVGKLGQPCKQGNACDDNLVCNSNGRCGAQAPAPSAPSMSIASVHFQKTASSSMWKSQGTECEDSGSDRAVVRGTNVGLADSVVVQPSDFVTAQTRPAAEAADSYNCFAPGCVLLYVQAKAGANAGPRTLTLSGLSGRSSASTTIQINAPNPVCWGAPPPPWDGRGTTPVAAHVVVRVSKMCQNGSYARPILTNASFHTSLAQHVQIKGFFGDVRACGNASRTPGRPAPLRFVRTPDQLTRYANRQNPLWLEAGDWTVQAEGLDYATGADITYVP